MTEEEDLNVPGLHTSVVTGALLNRIVKCRYSDLNVIYSIEDSLTIPRKVNRD